MGDLTKNTAPKSLPPLAVYYSWPKILFIFVFSLAIFLALIWGVTEPWHADFSHPDFSSWYQRRRGLRLPLYFPVLVPFFIMFLAGPIHLLRQALKGSPAAVITDKGIFSRRWGFTLPWHVIDKTTVHRRLGFHQYTVIEAPACLKPLQKSGTPIFSFFFGWMIDSRGTRGTVFLPGVIKNPQSAIDTLHHYLGDRMK